MVKTLPEVEQAIAQYQTHIRDLEKIITDGTPAGQAAAKKKLAEVKKNLDLLLKQRKRLSSELSGLGNDPDKMVPIWGFIGLLALMGLLFSKG